MHLTKMVNMVSISGCQCDFTFKPRAHKYSLQNYRIFLWLLQREAQCNWSDYIGSDSVWECGHNFCYVWPRSSFWAYTKKWVVSGEYLTWHLHVVCCIISCHLWMIMCVKKMHEKQHALFPWAAVTAMGVWSWHSQLLQGGPYVLMYSTGLEPLSLLLLSSCFHVFRSLVAHALFLSSQYPLTYSSAVSAAWWLAVMIILTPSDCGLAMDGSIYTNNNILIKLIEIAIFFFSQFSERPFYYSQACNIG